MGGSRCAPQSPPSTYIAHPVIPVSSVAQLVDLSAKFRIILSLTSPHPAHSLPNIDDQDYDFTPWLADLLPPMRPLVWSLVLRIFPRLLAKHECEKAFEAALFSAHALPPETLKQIEVNAYPSELDGLHQCADFAFFLLLPALWFSFGLASCISHHAHPYPPPFHALLPPSPPPH